MRPSNNLENKTPSDTYWRVQLVCVKVQATTSLEPPLEYNQKQMLLMNQGLLWPLLTILGVTEILCSFRLVPEGKTGKEIPEPSILEFLEKFSASNFALSDAEDNTCGLLNTRGIADLSFLRTLLAICQKFQEASFWEVIDSFDLLAYTSLAASRTLSQLLACLNFPLDPEDLFCWYKQKK